MSRSIIEGQPAFAGQATRLRALLVGLVLSLLLASAGVQAGEPNRLDLNRATAAELEALPGIGAVKAAAIVAERESNGGFQSIDELESVRGIGPSLVTKLRPHVTLGSRSKPAPKVSGSAGPSGK